MNKKKDGKGRYNNTPVIGVNSIETNPTDFFGLDRSDFLIDTDKEFEKLRIKNEKNLIRTLYSLNKLKQERE